MKVLVGAPNLQSAGLLSLSVIIRIVFRRWVVVGCLFACFGFSLLPLGFIRGFRARFGVQVSKAKEALSARKCSERNQK